MAAFPRTVSQSPLDNTVCDAERLPPGRSGAVIKAGPVYIASDGLWRNSSGAAANAAAKVHGWCLKDYPNIGGAVDVYKSPNIPWGPSTATPGAPLYLSTTAGELDTATTTGSTVPVAFVCGLRPRESTPHAMISTTRIF